MHKLFLSVLAVIVIATCGAAAQSPFEVHAGGGWTRPTGDMGGQLTSGGHFQVGGGFNVLPLLDLQADYMYNSFGVTSSYANSQLATGGSAHLNSVTVDPRLHVGIPATRLGVYALGGIGYYRRTIDFSGPSFSLHNGAFGYNVGGGITYKVFGPVSAYFEVRYHDAFTGRGNTQMVPFTIGIRF